MAETIIETKLRSAIKPRIGVIAVASPLEVGAANAPALCQAVARTLEAAGEPLALGVVDSADRAAEAGKRLAAEGADIVVAVAASWFEDYLVLDLLEEHPAPLVLWSVPGMETGSLCGCQQTNYMVRGVGRESQMLFAPADDVAAADRVRRMAVAAAVRRRLRRARVGLLGHRVEGMTETTVHELALKRQLGPRVVNIDSHTFAERTAAAGDAAALDLWRTTCGQAGSVTSTEADGVAATKAHLALAALVDELGLDAVAAGCYPELMGRVCLSASLLGETGTPVACEGDVNGAVAMLALAWMSGAPVHNTDLLDPLPEDDAIVFSHCGSGGFSLAEDRAKVELAPVRLMDRGVCCRFPSRPGPVTLVNLIPELSGYKLAVAYGEALPTGMVFPGNPLKVRFAVPYGAVLDWIAAEALGHHWMAAYGDYRAELRHLARLTGCGFTELGPTGGL